MVRELETMQIRAEKEKYWVTKMQYSAANYRDSMRNWISIFPWLGTAGATNAIYKKKKKSLLQRKETFRLEKKQN